MDGFDYIHALEAELNRWNREAEAMSEAYLRTKAAMERNLLKSHEILIAEDTLATMRLMTFMMMTMRSLFDGITALRLEKRPEDGKE